MKTSQRLLTAVTLAFAGQVILVADTPPPPPEAPPAPTLEVAAPAVASAMAEVQRELAHVHKTVARDVARAAQAQHALLLAQARHGSEDAADLDIEVPEPPEPPEPFGMVDVTTGIPFALEGGAGASVAPLFIAAGEVEPGTVAESQEDLAIMSRILSKAAARGGESADPMALGIMLSSFPGLRRPQAMQLDGYGALFLVNVSFPLAAPADKAESQPDKPTNTTWEQARRELYGQKRSPGDVFMYKRGSGRKPVTFEPGRVERLERDLIDALKNGANLRHVKPEENLVVVVSSTGGGGERGMHLVKAEVRRGYGATTREEMVTGDGPAGASTMVLRVKKSEAEQFAAGKLGPDEFRKRVGVTVY